MSCTENPEAEVAYARLTAAIDADPRANPYGIYVAFDEQAHINITLPVFAWSQSWQSATQLVCEVLPLVHVAANRFVIEVAANGVDLGRQIEAVVAGHTLRDSIDEVNAIVTGWWQLVWTGTFTDLTDGMGAWETSVREAFRDEEDDAARPIGAREQADFLDFLREFGA